MTYSFTRLDGQPAECVNPTPDDKSFVPTDAPASLPAGVFLVNGCNVLWGGNVYSIYADTLYHITTDDQQMYDALSSIGFH